MDRKKLNEILDKHVQKFFAKAPTARFDDVPNETFIDAMEEAINYTHSCEKLKKSIQQDFERWYLSEGYTPTEKIGVYKNGCNITLHAHLFYKYVNDVKF